MFPRWLILLFLSVSVQGQKQLALVKSGSLVGTFPEGGYIRMILKDGQKKEGHIVELTEFSMITSADTVPFNKIKKIRIPKGKHKDAATKFGKLLIICGLGYVTIDQLNRALGYNNAGGEEQVVKTSAILVTAGGVLLLIRPRYHRVNMGTVLRTVDYKSPFYKSEE